MCTCAASLPGLRGPGRGAVRADVPAVVRRPAGVTDRSRAAGLGVCWTRTGAPTTCGGTATGEGGAVPVPRSPAACPACRTTKQTAPAVSASPAPAPVQRRRPRPRRGVGRGGRARLRVRLRWWLRRDPCGGARRCGADRRRWHPVQGSVHLRGVRPVRGVRRRHRPEQVLPGRGEGLGHDGGAGEAGDGGLHREAGVLGAPREQLQEREPEGVDVARGRHRLAPDLLGGQICGGADDAAGAGQPQVAVAARDAEVGQVGVAVRVQEDVGGLQVPMHDPVTVDVLQGCRDLGGDRADVHGAGAGRRPGETAALGKVHRAPRGVVVDTCVPQRDDVRMAEPFEQPHLGAEPVAVQVVRGRLSRDERLDGDVATPRQILGAPHLRRRTTPQQVHPPIAATAPTPPVHVLTVPRLREGATRSCRPCDLWRPDQVRRGAPHCQDGSSRCRKSRVRCQARADACGWCSTKRSLSKAWLAPSYVSNSTVAEVLVTAARMVATVWVSR